MNLSDEEIQEILRELNTSGEYDIKKKRPPRDKLLTLLYIVEIVNTLLLVGLISLLYKSGAI